MHKIKKIEKIFEIFKVETVYHAAAYKHVPLVEENICEGVKNNIFSTLAISKASVTKNVSNLVLISSDKAVRPTNIMGASKRISELCVQGIYTILKYYTQFSIVRFGNVLESSDQLYQNLKANKRRWTGYINTSRCYKVFHDCRGGCAISHSSRSNGEKIGSVCS